MLHTALYGLASQHGGGDAWTDDAIQSVRSERRGGSAILG